MSLGAVGRNLGLEPRSREAFLRLLDHVLDALPPQRVHFGKKGTPPSDRHAEMYPKHVFDIPLAGVKRIVFGHAGQPEDRLFPPGDLLYCEPLAWKLPRWDRPHELCCLVFDQSFVRITYVDATAGSPPGERPSCTCFYHTQLPPAPALRSILRTFAQLAEPGDPGQAAPDLARALLRLVRAQVAADRAPRLGKAQATFQNIQQYLADHYSSPLSREGVARLFRLHPSYLSRLCQEQGGMSFSEHLRHLRMEQAALLLKETKLQVDQVCDRCGYRSVTFFTTAFRNYHGLPPGEFRRS
ncbi:MAG: helix-turn-helix transcriptional regulator [Lentisphaeria bacterium]|nr:helix-turn-helix transcriptional regulator [Lentisphaeria bacterium]